MDRKKNEIFIIIDKKKIGIFFLKTSVILLLTGSLMFFISLTKKLNSEFFKRKIIEIQNEYVPIFNFNIILENDSKFVTLLFIFSVFSFIPLFVMFLVSKEMGDNFLARNNKKFFFYSFLIFFLFFFSSFYTQSFVKMKKYLQKKTKQDYNKLIHWTSFKDFLYFLIFFIISFLSLCLITQKSHFTISQ